MYTDVVPPSSAGQVSERSQSNGGVPDLEAIRVATRRARRRSAMRRPVVPVPPVSRMSDSVWLVMSPTQVRMIETFHSWVTQMHTTSSTIDALDRMSALLDGPRARGAFVVR